MPRMYLFQKRRALCSSSKDPGYEVGHGRALPGPGLRGGGADWAAARGPQYLGPQKIVYKNFLEQNKISYTLDRILYVSQSLL